VEERKETRGEEMRQRGQGMCLLSRNRSALLYDWNATVLKNCKSKHALNVLYAHFYCNVFIN